MKDFFKKYWFTGLFLIILLLPTFYVNHQESYYSDIDNKRMREAVFMILITLLSAFAVFMVIVWVKRGFKIKDMPTGLIGITGANIALYFVLSPLFLSFIYFTNGLFTTGTANEKYIVSFIDIETKRPTLYSPKEHQILWNDKLKVNEQHLHLAVSDTVTVAFKKGLLGYYFDPELQ